MPPPSSQKGIRFFDSRGFLVTFWPQKVPEATKNSKFCTFRPIFGQIILRMSGLDSETLQRGVGWFGSSLTAMLRPPLIFQHRIIRGCFAKIIDQQQHHPPIPFSVFR